MDRRRSAALIVIAALALVVGPSGASGSAPSAPSLLAPASGASVTVPFTISWSAVSSPNGILAYNDERKLVRALI